MRQFAMRIVLSLFVGLGMMHVCPEVHGGKLDLSLARFVSCDETGVTPGANCVADVVGYERFIAEYAFGLAPKNLAPAETL